MATSDGVLGGTEDEVQSSRAPFEGDHNMFMLLSAIVGNASFGKTSEQQKADSVKSADREPEGVNHEDSVHMTLGNERAFRVTRMVQALPTDRWFVSMSVTADKRLRIKSQMFFTYVDQKHYMNFKPKFKRELVEHIRRRLGELANEYKVQAAQMKKTGSAMLVPKKQTVKMSVDSDTVVDYMEPLSTSAFSPRKQAVFHLDCYATLE